MLALVELQGSQGRIQGPALHARGQRHVVCCLVQRRRLLLLLLLLLLQVQVRVRVLVRGGHPATHSLRLTRMQWV